MDINVWGQKNVKSHSFQTQPNNQPTNNVTKEKKRNISLFSLGYLLPGLQLKTLEDFFMELFNYLYFTCQKKKIKEKVANSSVLVAFLSDRVSVGGADCERWKRPENDILCGINSTADASVLQLNTKWRFLSTQC